MAKWIIYGNSISTLVSADLLAAAGNHVELINPGKSWGGVFAGLDINGLNFDAGMTNFEFELFGTPAEDVRSYDPDLRSELGRYTSFVKAYLSGLCDFHAIDTPQMVFDGRIHPDLIISNQFDVLHGMPAPTIGAICEELIAICERPNPMHARWKHSRGSSSHQSPLRAVSIANHGPTLHRTFIEPMFNKVLDRSTADIAATFHRNGWVPLFYPETLKSQFSGFPQQLPPTRFHYPDALRFGSFVESLMKRLRSSDRVTMSASSTITAVSPGERQIRASNKVVSFDRLLWAAPLEQLAALLGLASGTRPPPDPAASLELWFAVVDRRFIRREWSVLIDPEPGSPFFRVTNQTKCTGSASENAQLIFESNSDVMARSGEGIDVFRSWLSRYGINAEGVLQLEKKTFNNVLKIPCIESWDAHTALRKEVSELSPDFLLSGSACGYLATTLNDQVLQALKTVALEG